MSSLPPAMPENRREFLVTQLDVQPITAAIYFQTISMALFETHEAFIASLHKEAAKLRGKKPTRAAK